MNQFLYDGQIDVRTKIKYRDAMSIKQLNLCDFDLRITFDNLA